MSPKSFYLMIQGALVKWISSDLDSQFLTKVANYSLNILFICSMNKWRSPTGEAIFWRHDGVKTRSAGPSSKARRQVNVTDVRWADLICVMEEKHQSRLRADFRGEVKHKAIQVLDIPDDYQFMDPELVDLISDAVGPMIDASNEPQESMT